MNEILHQVPVPVYFYGISAQMKTFIDRTYPIWQHLGKKYTILFLLDQEKTSLKDRWEIWMDLLNIWKSTKLMDGYMQQMS